MTMLTVPRGATRRAIFSWDVLEAGLLLIESEGRQDTGIGILDDCCGKVSEDVYSKKDGGRLRSWTEQISAVNIYRYM